MTETDKDDRKWSTGPEGQKWTSAHGMRLTKGMILRTPLDEKHFENGCLYGECTGEGYGCKPNLRGTAIYMEHVTQSVAETEKGMGGTDRWERYQLIEVMEGTFQ